MKILVINPPSSDHGKIIRDGRCMQVQDAWGTNWPPYSLASIAAVLRREEFEVSLLDCSNDRMPMGKLGEEIEKSGAELVVVAAATPTIESDLRVARIASATTARASTVFFGTHPTALAEQTFELDSAVKYLVHGEPEFVIRDLAVTLRDGLSPETVKGLMFKKPGGNPVCNPPMPFIEDLDALPIPAWDLCRIKRYRLPLTGRPFLLVGTARGCPHTCLFCPASAFYGRRVRLRTAASVVEEIGLLRKKHKVDDFLFWAESSMSNREQMIEISRGLASKEPGVRWVCNGRVDDADLELLAEMKRGGCWMVGYGIESGSQRVLDLMSKRVKVEQIREAVEMTHKAGLQTTAHVILGFPGETREDIELTRKLILELPLNFLQVYCCVPYPGSALFLEALWKGWLTTTKWAKFEQHQAIVETVDLKAKEVMAARAALLKAFYFRWRTIKNIMSQTKGLRGWLSFLLGGRRYLRSWARS